MKLFAEEYLSRTSFAQSKWFKTPTKAQLILVSLIWLIGTTLVVLEKTHYFLKTFFNLKNMGTYFILMISISILVNVYRNYFKQAKVN